jgi:hypothetical protein
MIRELSTCVFLDSIRFLKTAYRLTEFTVDATRLHA